MNCLCHLNLPLINVYSCKFLGLKKRCFKKLTFRSAQRRIILVLTLFTNIHFLPANMHSIIGLGRQMSLGSCSSLNVQLYKYQNTILFISILPGYQHSFFVCTSPACICPYKVASYKDLCALNTKHSCPMLPYH